MAERDRENQLSGVNAGASRGLRNMNECDI